MNTHEQRIREFAYQIWESEGRPMGQECRHWDMACKLASDLHNSDESDQAGSGQLMSMIAPEDGSTIQLDVNSMPQQPPHANTPPQPAEPIAPVENPPHISPTPPAQPIHPTDPVQPDNPAKPMQPYTSKRTATASKAALESDGVKPASTKKPAKPRKAKAKEDPVSL